MFFTNTTFQKKLVGFSEIRTRIVGVEGKHADHLTTTTAQLILYLLLEYEKNKNKLKRPRLVHF